MKRGPWNTLNADAVKVDASGFSGLLSALDTDVQLALATLDAGGGSGASLDTTNFDGILSASENTIQKAFDAIDDFTDVKTDLNAPNGKLTAGTQGAALIGSLWLYGANVASGAGGQIALFVATGHNGTITGYTISPDDDDLIIGPSTDVDALKYDGGNGKWIIDGQTNGVELLHAGTLKLATTAAGISITDGTATAATIGFSDDDLVIQNNDGEGDMYLNVYDGEGYQTGIHIDMLGAVTLYHSNSNVLTTKVAGIILGQGSQSGLEIYYSDDDAYFVNTDPDGEVFIQARDTGDSNTNTLFHGDPDGAAELYYAGVLTLYTENQGICVQGANSSALLHIRPYGNGFEYYSEYQGAQNALTCRNTADDGDVTCFKWGPDDGDTVIYNGTSAAVFLRSNGIELGTSERPQLYKSSVDFYIVNQGTSGTLYIKGADSGDNSDNMITANADGAVELYYAGTAMLKTVDGGISFGSSGSQVTMVESGDNVSITNTAADGALTLYVTKSGPTTQAGITISPGSSVALAYDGVNKFQTDTDGVAMVDAGKIVWDAAPASDATGTGDQITVTVDQNTVGAGGLLRQENAAGDGNFDDADKDSAATCGRLVLALESGTGSKKVLERGYFRLDSWNWTPGEQLYVGDSGAITNDVSGYTTGDIVQVVGYAHTADIIRFNPSPDYLEVA